MRRVKNEGVVSSADELFGTGHNTALCQMGMGRARTNLARQPAKSTCEAPIKQGIRPRVDHTHHLTARTCPLRETGLTSSGDPIQDTVFIKLLNPPPQRCVYTAPVTATPAPDAWRVLGGPDEASRRNHDRTWLRDRKAAPAGHVNASFAAGTRKSPGGGTHETASPAPHCAVPFDGGRTRPLPVEPAQCCIGIRKIERDAAGHPRRFVARGDRRLRSLQRAFEACALHLREGRALGAPADVIKQHPVNKHGDTMVRRASRQGPSVGKTDVLRLPYIVHHGLSLEHSSVLPGGSCIAGVAPLEIGHHG